MPQQTERLTKPKDRGDSFEKRTDPSARKFYQGKKWRGFRSRMKKKQRKIDEGRVHDLYKELKNTVYSSYSRWLQSDNPLCVDCLKEGYIRQGVVADHIKRIRSGGTMFDPDNIAFRCQSHHNIKSGKESHE